MNVEKTFLVFCDAFVTKQNVIVYGVQILLQSAVCEALQLSDAFSPFFSLYF